MTAVAIRGTHSFDGGSRRVPYGNAFRCFFFRSCHFVCVFCFCVGLFFVSFCGFVFSFGLEFISWCFCSDFLFFVFVTGDHN